MKWVWLTHWSWKVWCDIRLVDWISNPTRSDSLPCSLGADQKPFFLLYSTWTVFACVVFSSFLYSAFSVRENWRMAMVKSPKKHVNLFYSLDCEELANKVASHSQTNITLQNIKWRSASTLSHLWSMNPPRIRRVLMCPTPTHIITINYLIFFKINSCVSVSGVRV